MRCCSLVLLCLFALELSARDPQRLSGSWHSDKTGHHGPMRARISPTTHGYRVIFVGRFLNIIPFFYSSPMQILAQDGTSTYLQSERRLPFFGRFIMTGTLSEQGFEARYHSSRGDQGRFQLRPNK